MSELVQTAAGWAWGASLYAGALVALLWCAQLIFGRWMSPAWRYGLGLLVLARLLLPLAPESAFSVSNLLPPAAPERPVPVMEVVDLEMPAAVGFSPALPAAGIDVAAPASPVAPRAASPSFDPIGALAWIWLLGVAAVLARAMLRHVRLLRWIRREGKPAGRRLREQFDRCGGARLRLSEVSGLGTVALVGLLRPRVIVPAGIGARMDEEELGYIFAHELAHWRKGDLVINWLAAFAGALHWFNPLAWLALRRMLADREIVRDAGVVRGEGRAGRLRYGRTLIKILETFQPARLSPGAAPAFNHKPEIRRRIVMIAKTTWNSRLAGAFCLLLAACLGTATFTTALADDERGEREERRERGERDGDRERGEREHDRERGERDGDRERDRERGDRERGERDSDRERDERERDHDEREHDHERGERDRERGGREQGERNRAEEFERRIHTLRLRVRELVAAGKIEEAERLEREIAAAMRARVELREREADRRREHTERERDQRADHLERRLHEITRHMEEMHRAMNEMRRELERLRGER